MWMPDWLYKRLPLVYSLAGLFCLSRLGSQPAMGLSALMLFAAAGLTFQMRRDAKRHAAARRPRRRVVAGLH